MSHNGRCGVLFGRNDGFPGPRRWIGIGRARDLDDAINARHRAARVIEKRAVAFFHGAHEIARLVIAHAVQCSVFFGRDCRSAMLNDSGSDFISQ